MFKQTLIDTIRLLVNDHKVNEKLWNDINAHYSTPNRYYHNLNHLDHIITEVFPVKEMSNNWNAMVLATAYHDIIYDPLRKNNEEMSAEYAERSLKDLVDLDTLEACKQMILATKTHMQSSLSDINYFIDADLAILATVDEKYHQYTRQIRMEYQYFPDLIYQPGRRKVVQHFLNMDRIYKSEYFYEKYEDLARQNLLNEYRGII